MILTKIETQGVDAITHASLMLKWTDTRMVYMDKV